MHGEGAGVPSARTRFLRTLKFEKTDRVPFCPGGGRKSTREAWLRQGLPPDVVNITEFAYHEAGGREELPREGEGFPVNERMIPCFDEKVIERQARTQLVQDWKGNICEIGNEFGVEFLRNPLDFVTRRWVKCPVESAIDWPDMKSRYDSRDPGRLPADAAMRGNRLRNRDWPVVIRFPGPFWQLREWLGFEKLCTMFIEEPAFLREMISFWENHVLVLMTEAFRYVVPDMVHVSEDMAFKQHAMISPAMAREFLLPTYRRWGDVLREAGVLLYGIDSDGYIDEMIPVWIEAGMNVCDPVEVAAGNDLPKLRRKYGTAMAFQGGIDKRAIAAGGDVIVNEIARIAPVVELGGYIPSCDHGVPNNVAWPDFVRYVGRLARTTGWL